MLRAGRCRGRHHRRTLDPQHASRPRWSTDMSDWIHGLPLWLMAIVIFGGAYLVAAMIYRVVLSRAVGDRARAFKGVSSGLLPPLGIIFGLLVAFLAAQ